jgi:hypothetical protein
MISLLLTETFFFEHELFLLKLFEVLRSSLIWTTVVESRPNQNLLNHYQKQPNHCRSPPNLRLMKVRRSFLVVTYFMYKHLRKEYLLVPSFMYSR